MQLIKCTFHPSPRAHHKNQSMPRIFAPPQVSDSLICRNCLDISVTRTSSLWSIVLVYLECSLLNLNELECLFYLLELIDCRASLTCHDFPKYIFLAYPYQKDLTHITTLEAPIVPNQSASSTVDCSDHSLTSWFSASSRKQIIEHSQMCFSSSSFTPLCIFYFCTACHFIFTFHSLCLSLLHSALRGFESNYTTALAPPLSCDDPEL